MTKQQRLVLVVSILASFVTFLDGSVVNVALPAISRELGGGLVVQQWVVDAYLITLGSLILLAGSLSDLFGRLRILKFGLLGFAAASLLCAIAPNALFLIISRGLQGISGALLVPSSLALIIAAFHGNDDGKAEGKAIGTWTAWTGMAFLVGPVLGGFLVDAASWRLIFAINVIPVAVTLWLMRSLYIKDEAEKGAEIDIQGAIFCTIGLGAPIYALIEQPRYGWSSPNIVLPALLGLAAFAWFLWHEHRTAKPMLPFSLFRVRNFSVGNIATIAIYAGLSVATFLIAIFVQQVGGYSAIEAGIALLPVTIIMFFLSSRFGALSGKLGPRLFMSAGPLVAASGFFLMLRVGPTISYWTDLFPGIATFGLGLSMTVAPLTSAILGSISSKQAGIGSAINNAVSRIAGLVAIAVIGLVTGSKLDLAGFHRGLLLTACLLAAGGLISAAGIRNIPPKHAAISDGGEAV
jgi:EmrB/QacA subfamily drug resistance transporter